MVLEQARCPVVQMAASDAFLEKKICQIIMNHTEHCLAYMLFLAFAIIPYSEDDTQDS